MPFPATDRAVDTAVRNAACPALVIEVGTGDRAIWRHAAGRLTYADEAPACTVETIFDLASLTKVMATTALAMRLVGAGRLTFDDPVSRWLDGWRADGRARVRLRHLLDHSSGLPAHDRMWEQAEGRAAYQAAIAAVPLDRAPGTAAVYSDLGFMLLGFVIEDAGGAGLAEQFEALASEAGLGEVRYGVLPDWPPRIAPTEVDPWRGRLLVGEVHDENAAALGGVAGHAGLFGTARAVGTFARLVLRTFAETTVLGTPDLMRTVASRSDVPGSSRALGWDTMLPTSSCGTRLSPHAIGHTGFTGTSLWVDPERDLYVTILANRVHPTRRNERFAPVRPLIHDAVVADLEGA